MNQSLSEAPLPRPVAPVEEVAEGLVSVVVPVSERPGGLADLYEEFSAPLRRAGFRFEFVFVVEPWFRPAARSLAALAERGDPVLVLEAGQPMGEGALVRLGAERARGSIVVTLPAYRRVEPDGLPELIRRVQAGADLATARRWPRHDSWVNRFQNRLLHVLLARLSSGRLHDVACGVRALRRELLEQLPLYGDFYRFLPLLALREGYEVEEVAIRQHPSDRGPRLHSPGVYLRRGIDVLGLFFLLRFTEKPLRFFGLIGAILGMVGGGILAVLFVQRLAGQGVAGRPLLLLGVLLFVLGVQAVALGLIGEIIVHLGSARRRSYRLRREGGGDGPG